MWFIGVEVEQETSAPPPKKNPGSAPDTEDQSFNKFENNKMKLSVYEAKLTGLWARNCAIIQQV